MCVCVCVCVRVHVCVCVCACTQVHTDCTKKVDSFDILHITFALWQKMFTGQVLKQACYFSSVVKETDEQLVTCTPTPLHTLALAVAHLEHNWHDWGVGWGGGGGEGMKMLFALRFIYGDLDFTFLSIAGFTK